MSEGKWVCKIVSRNEDGTFNMLMSPGAVHGMEMEFGVSNFEEWADEVFGE